MNEATERAVDVLAEAMNVAIVLRDRLPNQSADGLPPVRHSTGLVDSLNEALSQLLADDLQRLGLRYGDMPHRELIARVRDSV